VLLCFPVTLLPVHPLGWDLIFGFGGRSEREDMAEGTISRSGTAGELPLTKVQSKNQEAKALKIAVFIERNGAGEGALITHFSIAGLDQNGARDFSTRCQSEGAVFDFRALPGSGLATDAVVEMESCHSFRKSVRKIAARFREGVKCCHLLFLEPKEINGSERRISVDDGSLQLTIFSFECPAVDLHNCSSLGELTCILGILFSSIRNSCGLFSVRKGFPFFEGIPHHRETLLRVTVVIVAEKLSSGGKDVVALSGAAFGPSRSLGSDAAEEVTFGVLTAALIPIICGDRDELLT